MGGESKKCLQFFDIVPGFIRKKNLKTDTNMLEAAIKDEQLQLDTHLALKPTGDVAAEVATDSGAEDNESSEEDGSDDEEDDMSNDGKPLTKCNKKSRGRNVRKAQTKKELDKLLKGAKSDTSWKTKRPKWTHH